MGIRRYWVIDKGEQFPSSQAITKKGNTYVSSEPARLPSARSPAAHQGAHVAGNLHRSLGSSENSAGSFLWANQEHSLPVLEDTPRLRLHREVTDQPLAGEELW